MRITQWVVKKFEGWLMAAAYRDESTRVRLISICDTLIHKIFAFGLSLMPDSWFLPDIEEMEEKLKRSSPVILRAMIEGYTLNDQGEWCMEPTMPVTYLHAYKAYGDILLPAFFAGNSITRKSWFFKERIYQHVGVTGRHVMGLGIRMKWGEMQIAAVFNRGSFVCSNRLIAHAIEESPDFKTGKIIIMTKEMLNAIKNFAGVPQTGAKMVEGPWSLRPKGSEQVD